MKDPHLDQWKRLYEEYDKINSEESQYRARCILGLIEGKTYDYTEQVKPKEIPFIK